MKVQVGDLLYWPDEPFIAMVVEVRGFGQWREAVLEDGSRCHITVAEIAKKDFLKLKKEIMGR